MMRAAPIVPIALLAAVAATLSASLGACSYGTTVVPICTVQIGTGGAGTGGSTSKGAGGAGGGATGTGGSKPAKQFTVTNSCDPPPKCDDGLGNIPPTQECCLLRGNDEYGLSCQQELPIGSDFRKNCAPLKMVMTCNTQADVATKERQKCCCNDAQKAFDECMMPAKK